MAGGTYQPDTPVGKVRLLVNDVDGGTSADEFVFSDAEIKAFLDLFDGAILLAAAEAIDTNADNEALASKVLRTQDLQTDGAKVADALRKRAASLRERHDRMVDDDGYFEIIDADPDCGVELGWF